MVHYCPLQNADKDSEAAHCPAVPLVVYIFCGFDHLVQGLPTNNLLIWRISKTVL